jgi:uncharacterized protein (DUF427 family)
MSPEELTADGRPIKHPGPEHPITVEPNPARVLVRASGVVIADSRNALTLREASYPPVQYVPLLDVERSLLEPSDHTSYCPFKGEASYYSVPVAGQPGENAVWEYREPYQAVAGISGHVAFYADRVEIEEQED